MSLPKFYLISPNYAESGALETLPDTPGLQIIKNDQLENSAIRFNPADLVCITSEASIEIVKKRLDDPTKVNAINMLKDKYQFRKILKEIYPEYRFEKLAFNDLSCSGIMNMRSHGVLDICGYVTDHGVPHIFR